MGRDRDCSDSPDRRRRSRSRSRSGSLERNIVRECWRPVKENPYDFDAWTKLLKLVEKLNDIRHAREAFEGFLKRYPFCYGYWKKYAEMEKQHKYYEKCLNVYEKGLEAIPLSVDLWLSYIAYVKEIAQGQRQATTKIRDVYMRALEACGLEFRSDKVWEEYIEWEIQNGELEKASVLYDVMIMTPTVGYAQHFEKYKAFVYQHEPDKILIKEEYDELTDVVHNKIKDQLDGRPIFFIEEYEDDNIPFDGENYEEMPKKIVRQRKHIDVALKAFRDEIIERRQRRFLDNQREISLRWNFENEIKRPYFHVKPLEREQLKNWHNYLDFEVKQKQKIRIKFLFERCMIACALYEEMWIKYAVYLDGIGDTEGARSVYKRASEVHVSRKPGIFLAFSAFEEKEGDTDMALKVLHDFDRRHSNYAAINLRMIAIERRRIMKEESEDFSVVVAKYERMIQDTSTSRRLASFYSMKLARFHAKIRHDRKLARKIIKEAISRDRDNVQLYVQLVDLAFNATHVRDSEVLAALEFAIESSDLSPEDRFQFSARKLEYLEEIGCDVVELHQHIAQHLALEKTLNTPNATIFHGKRAPLNNVVQPPSSLATTITAATTTPVPQEQQQQQQQSAVVAPAAHVVPQEFPKGISKNLL